MRSPFTRSIVNVVDTTVVKSTKFMGEILNNEFGPSWMPDVSRDNEVAATYITKMIHLLGSDPAVRPPSAYGYWALSDLYEEIDTGIDDRIPARQLRPVAEGRPRRSRSRSTSPSHRSTRFACCT